MKRAGGHTRGRASVLEGLRLGPGEVAHIFDHPLVGLFDPKKWRGMRHSCRWAARTGHTRQSSICIRCVRGSRFRAFLVVIIVLLEMNQQNFADAHGLVVRIACITSGAPPRQ